MKVLYVDMQYDYGVKERGPNFIGQDGFLYAIRQSASAVETFYYDEYLNNTAPLQEKLLARVEEVNPDVVFFILYKDQFYKETLKKLKERCITVNWFGDDTWRYDDFSSGYADCFTYCVTTDKFSIPKYEKIPGVKVLLSQWAAIDKYCVDLNQTKIEKFSHDVSFIGGRHPYREWFFSELSKHGIRVDCYGHGWSNGSISMEDFVRISMESKISFNLANSKSFDYRCLLSSAKSFYINMKTPKVADQVKARNFEIPCYGGFQMSDFTPEIGDYLNIGSELCAFKTVDDAALLINYYLENQEERETMRMAANQRSIKEHCYSHRMKKILDSIT